MSSVVIAGDTSGSVTLQAPATAGSVVVTLPGTSGTMAVNGSTGSFTTLTSTGASSFATSSGNVGIGTGSPNQKLSIAGTVGAGLDSISDAIYQRAQAVSGTYWTILHSGTGLTGTYPDNVTDSTAGSHIRLSSGDLTNDFAGVIDICAYGKAGSSVGNYISFSKRTGVNTITESMRIDSSGNLSIGATSSAVTGRGPTRLGATAASGQDTLGLSQPANTSFSLSSLVTTTSGTRYHIGFGDGTSWNERGTISTNGTSTSYNTSSDYRLKENVAPMLGALAKVSALKPVTYTWKETGTKGEGFIAHELAEVCPDAVTGEKDGLKEDGTPRYQQIDTSFLVATLTAAIQELNAKVTALEAQLGAK